MAGGAYPFPVHVVTGSSAKCICGCDMTPEFRRSMSGGDFSSLISSSGKCVRRRGLRGSLGFVHIQSRSRRRHRPHTGVTPSHLTLLSAHPRHAFVVRGFLYRGFPSEERWRFGLEPGGVGGGCLVSMCLK